MTEKMITYYKDTLDIPDLVRTMQTVHGHDFEEPFYICDLSEIINKFVLWKRFLPRVAPFYAVKCNNYHPLLDLLVKLGIGFDCASPNEITKIMDFGVHPNRILFANTVKTKSDILHARERGIKRMTFDNECELLKIKKYYPDAELLLRIRSDSKKAWVKFSVPKFGCDPKTEAYDLIELASSLNMKIVGICFHVGSGCLDNYAYAKGLAAARKIFDFSSKIGMPMTLLDIGGGFIDEIGSFSQMTKIINQALQTYFPNNDVTIVAEPGRFFASSSFTLVTKIINTKEIQDNDKMHYLYTINCGIHTGFSYMLFGDQLKKPELIREAEEKRHRSMIWGPSCDPNDKLYENILMPKLNTDDILLVRGFGAYTIVLATEFNGFNLPEIHPYINVKHEHINPQLEWNRETNV